MNAEKPLTRSELIQVLKEIGVVTKNDVRDIVKNDVRDIVEESQIHLEQKLKRYIGKVKREVLTAVANLALTTPTRKEFEELKERVDHLAKN